MMKILVPVDGSELSLDAVRYALSLRAKGLRCEFVLANVQEPASLYEVVTVRDADRLVNLSDGAARHLLQGARELCDAAGAPYECEVATGDAAHMLLEICESRGCNAIVIGARGHGGLIGTRLGTVSQEIVHTSTVPVMVVKHAAVEDTAARDETDAEAANDPAEDVVGLA